MASIGHVAIGMSVGRWTLSPRGLYVVAVEFVAFLPFWAYALWPRRRAALES